MRFRLSTLERSKTIELHVVTQVELYTHASNTRANDIFGHRFHFDERLRPFSTIHTNKICMRFHFDPLSRVFSNRCVFIENTQRTGVDMYAYWCGNVCVFGRKSISVNEA